MNTFKTIEEAREHARGIENIVCIAEIEPGQPDINPYVCLKCSIDSIRQMLANKPMPEIKGVIREAANLADERAAAKNAKIKANIPGLDELQACVNDWDNYHEGFNQMMEDEDNDGVNPPKRPAKEVAGVAAQYPIASAYVKADNWSLASHYAKSGAGDRAKEKIINGEDYKSVIADMEKEWSDHTKAHMWD